MQPIVPDVFVRPGPDGGWLIELNSDTLPKVLVNQSYYAEVAKTAKNDKDKTYLADCLQTATWLIRALDQRAKTILKVSTEIVRQQDAFFAHGVQHLRPLNLKTIADAIGMHESTVSRVTANKYMATSRGIFELKYFFTSAIAAADGGEAHSAEAVRHRIKQLIDAESPRRRCCPTTRSWRCCARPASTSPGGPSRSIARPCGYPSSVQRRREKQTLHGRDGLKQRCDVRLRRRSAAGIAIWRSCVTVAYVRRTGCVRDQDQSALTRSEADHAVSRLGQEHRHRRGVAQRASTRGSPRRRRSISTAAFPAT